MEKYQVIISQLKKTKNILAVYLFGSCVYGKKGKLSDFDIGVLFEDPREILADPKKSLAIYERLFDIFAPLVKEKKKSADKLDLVFLQKTPLSLQKEVLLKGKLLYSKDQEKLLNYKETVLLKYADLKPILNQFYQEVFKTRL